ncbi:MAG TPA: phosphotransferase [Galbitalea sp.]|jgi:predicted trehalose synthase
MAELALPEPLLEWIPRQRWYAGKGQGASLTRRGGWTITPEDAEILTHYVLDRQPSGATLYQVPLTRRGIPLEGVAPIWNDESGYYYDAPHDPAYVEAILRLIVTESETGGTRGHRQPGSGTVRILDSSVLRGEQSNTSIICRVDGGSPIIVKVFRALHAGDNPDVVLQSAISAAGSSLVPASVGYVSGEWPDRAQPNGTAHGSLAFAQEFLEGAEDAWRTALRAATAGEDFSLRARRLGSATAELHQTLAAAMPTREPEQADIDRLLAGMSARADSALGAVPDLERYRGAIEATIAAVRSTPWPRLQRIHGDFHLGQVLAVGDAWVMVDFEGEPLRPMAERSELDLAVRDVAGMLRSFDYVAGAVLHSGAPETELSPTEWARSARLAFLAGYAESSTTGSTDSGLLDALELDKALYEAVYEARNRPDWLGIPVEAVQRLAGVQHLS